MALPSALERLARLRSPAWALAWPGSLVVGTFGVLALPPPATGLVLVAAIATPVLAAIAGGPSSTVAGAACCCCCHWRSS